MTYKEWLYKWLIDTKHDLFSIEEMLSLSDFADWLDAKKSENKDSAECLSCGHVFENMDCPYCNSLGVKK